jgi:translation initiation factor 2B subunit (eIF-2B alpha/beta/delta family)
LKVIIAESRPKFEGRILTKKLLKVGIKVLLIPDCNSAEYISDCDLVLLGTDKILLDRDVVNKIGSRNTAIIAKYYRKPVYVLASVNKFSKQKKFKPTLNSPEEIWKYNHPDIKIVNQYFEVVPRKLITKFITENAVL